MRSQSTRWACPAPRQLRSASLMPEPAAAAQGLCRSEGPSAACAGAALAATSCQTSWRLQQQVCILQPGSVLMSCGVPSICTHCAHAQPPFSATSVLLQTAFCSRPPRRQLDIRHFAPALLKRVQQMQAPSKLHLGGRSAAPSQSTCSALRRLRWLTGSGAACCVAGMLSVAVGS